MIGGVLYNKKKQFARDSHFAGQMNSFEYHNIYILRINLSYIKSRNQNYSKGLLWEVKSIHKYSGK